MHAQAHRSLPLPATLTASLRLPRLKRPQKLFLNRWMGGEGAGLREGGEVPLGQQTPSQALSLLAQALLARGAAGWEELEVFLQSCSCGDQTRLRGPCTGTRLSSASPPRQSEGAPWSSHHGSWDSPRCQLTASWRQQKDVSLPSAQCDSGDLHSLQEGTSSCFRL